MVLFLQVNEACIHRGIARYTELLPSVYHDIMSMVDRWRRSVLLGKNLSTANTVPVVYDVENLSSMC